MREIIFRAKVEDKDELIGKGFPINGTMTPISEWVYGVPIPRYPDLFLAWSEGNGEYEEITVISETIGEYTCLTDKNGTRIFEGDIVAHPEYGPLAVVWDDGLFQLAKHDTFYERLDHYSSEVAIIIGNIHDNPELLTDSN